MRNIISLYLMCSLKHITLWPIYYAGMKYYTISKPIRIPGHDELLHIICNY